MTRTDIALRIQLFFNNPIYLDPQSVNDSIQDGLDEIAAFTGCVYKSAVLPFTQYTSYYDLLTLLSDYVGAVAIFNNSIKRWLYPESLKKFWQTRIDWDAVYGTPYYFSPINHRYLSFYMKPGSSGYGNFVIFYRAQAPQLSDSTTIPIPDEHIICLEDYVEMDLWEQQQEWGKAQTAFKKYKVNLEKLRVLVRNQRNRDRYMSLR